MRKTRILAALLCIMMIVTAIPVLQASANSSVATYTLEQALEGAEQVYTAVFADDAYTAITGTTYYYDTNEKYVKWKEAGYSNDIIRDSDGGRLALLCDNEGGFVNPVGLVKSRWNSNADANAFCRAEMQLEDGSLTGQAADGNSRLLVVDMTAEGLAIRAGNDATGNNNATTPAGGSGEGAGWTWDNTNVNTNYGFLEGKLDVDTGYAGAMLFKLKLTTDGSVAEVNLTDGANGQVSTGFRVTNSGIQMINASNFAYGDEAISSAYVAEGDVSTAAYPLTTGTWYEILLKNNYNRYTIYAREAGTTGFTKVVTGTPVGAAMPNSNKVLSLKAYYNTTGLKATEKVTINGVTKEYFADQYDTTDEGVTAIVAGNGSRALSEVIFGSITTYEDSSNSGLGLQDVLGASVVTATKMDFDNAESKKQLDEGKPLSLWGASTAAGTRNADGNMVLDAQAQLDFAVLNPTMNANQAFEISYLMPETETAAKLGLRGGLSSDIGGRLYADLDADANRQMVFYSSTQGMVLYNNKDLSVERTLLVNPDGNGALEYYMKNPVSGKYLFLGKATAHTGSLSGSFFLKNSTAAGSSALEDYAVTGFAVYQKTGNLTNADLLPGDTSAMRQYVNEDFTAIDETNYQPSAYAGEGNEGSATCADGMLAIARPTYSADVADQYSFFDLNNAGIPKGGYANIRFQTSAGRGFRIVSGDGETEYTLTVGADTQLLRATPDTVCDLRLVRDAEGDFTAYLKRADESVWTKIADNVTPGASANGKNRLRMGGYHFGSPYATSNATSIDYVDSVSIYGPVGEQILTILDDNDNTQTTIAATSGSKLNYGVKAVVAPGAERKLIFAGYDANMNLMEAEPVTVEASETETVKTPTLSDSRIETIKVFLWDNFEQLTSLTPAVEFTAPE